MNPISIHKTTGLSRSALMVVFALSLTGCATTLSGDEEVVSAAQAQPVGTTASATQNAIDDSEKVRGSIDSLFFESNPLPVSGTAGNTKLNAAKESKNANANPGLRVPYVFVAGEQGRNTVHSPGSTFSVDVAIDSDANLYCYLLDENQRVTQFFPNRLQEDPSVEAGTRMQFPGKFPFEFFASRTSKVETITCIAATQSVGVVPLKSLPVASDVEQIHQTFAAVAGPDVKFGVGVYAVNFK